jgi:hypothetical protein
MCALKGVQERGYQAVAAGFQLRPRGSELHARSVSNMAALVYEPLCIRHSNMLYRCLRAAMNMALQHAEQGVPRCTSQKFNNTSVTSA